MKKILVAGASGHLGRYVIKGLDERGHWIRALVRDAAPVRSIEHAIDDTSVGDATKPETLRGACDGIELLFFSGACPRRGVGPLALARAARDGFTGKFYSRTPEPSDRY